MTTLRSVFERIGKAAPSLRSWADSLPDDDDALAGEWSQLAHELADLAPDGTVPALRAIAPLLDEALERYDHDDRVSLGFIETLICLAEQKRLDPLRLRSALGPVGQPQWDSLADYLHQTDWSLIQFDGKHIGGFVSGPTHLERWLVKPGARVPADASLARLISRGVSYELSATEPCRVDRFAVKDGHALTEGDLLCYLLPDDYREFHRSSPYVTLRSASHGAAA